MHSETTAMATRPRILITEEDMARLRQLVRHGRMSAHRDQEHLAGLDDELDRAEVVASGEVSEDVVTMHSTVRVRDVETGMSVVYTLVFPAHADIERKRISVLAPVGTALIGCREGDVIEWATPGGGKRLRIEEVVFQPEAAAGRAAESMR
jgi:regulator of nucleoside diphosphate kinase